MIILDFFHLTLELVIGFFALLITTRILGKTQIKQLTPFDFISALVLGELVGNAIYNKEINVLHVVFAITIWGILIWIIEKLGIKYNKLRKVIDGKPLIVIRKGQIDIDVLKKEKLNTNELLSLLRSKDVFSIREVEYAILEPSGSISILMNYKYDKPTNEDLNQPNKAVYLPVTFILDGEIILDNLNDTGFNKIWLQKELIKQGVSSEKEVFYGEWKDDEGLYLVKK